MENTYIKRKKANLLLKYMRMQKKKPAKFNRLHMTSAYLMMLMSHIYVLNSSFSTTNTHCIVIR